jgi:hypothetical protein
MFNPGQILAAVCSARVNSRTARQEMGLAPWLGLGWRVIRPGLGLALTAPYGYPYYGYGGASTGRGTKGAHPRCVLCRFSTPPQAIIPLIDSPYPRII